MELKCVEEGTEEEAGVEEPENVGDEDEELIVPE